MPVKIESAANAVYKHIKKLHSKSGRTKFSQYLAEGKRAVSDALANGADVECVVVCDGVDFEPGGVKVYVLSEKLFDSLKLTVNSQGILAVMNYTLKTTDEMDFNSYSNILYLDAVTDPGNMGTILRSADALGADAVILGEGCVDIFNPKVVRSSMASILNVPVFADENYECTFERMENGGFQIIATLPRAEKLCCDADFEKKTVLVMGNEANGIRDEIIGRCNFGVKIPMLERTESLNVATATTVMLYEIMRYKLKNGNE